MRVRIALALVSALVAAACGAEAAGPPDGARVARYAYQPGDSLTYDVEQGMSMTMEGTPEGKTLKRMLGTRSEDLAYLALDRLDTFLSTDVAVDPAIRAVMDDAGCGHLLDISPLPPEALVAGRAAEVKRYLMLDAGGASPAAAALRASLAGGGKAKG